MSIIGAGEPRGRGCEHWVGKGLYSWELHGKAAGLSVRGIYVNMAVIGLLYEIVQLTKRCSDIQMGGDIQGRRQIMYQVGKSQNTLD